MESPVLDAEQKTLERATIEPHPVMADYYGERSARAGFVRSLFNDTAHHYDRINGLFSIGSGNWYRKHSLVRAGLAPGHRVLDVAIGTGLVARQAAAITGPQGLVIGLDLSEGMLREARRTLDIPLVQGTAESLPLADASVDFVTMGYALRHVSDLTATFREFRRVLRPSGTVLLLEIARPTRPMVRHAVHAYLGGLVPLISRVSGGGSDGMRLMRYYWETIDRCVPPETIERAMADAGFTGVRCDVDFDMFRNYSARRG
jgi:demethylmenaquinone methyltransferase/2-methoxy-6-polyprenyl-1,4-benzoquinol methylase